MKNIGCLILLFFSCTSLIAENFNYFKGQNLNTTAETIIPTDFCNDGIQNNGEMGIDCGGLFCAPCEDGGLAVIQNVMTHKKISEFPFTDYNIEFSNDGARAIVSGYLSSGTLKKVFTYSLETEQLNEIFDYADWRTGCPCRTPYIDINDEGTKILWTDGEYEIFVSDFDGSNRKIIADVIKNQNTNLADFSIFTYSTPKFNNTGTHVYFFQNNNGTDNRGLWKASVNSSIVQEQLFSFSDFDDEFQETSWDGITTDFLGIHVGKNNEILFLTSILDESSWDYDLFTYKNGNFKLFDKRGPKFAEEKSFHLSKDGETAVWLEKDGGSKVYLKNLDGTNERVLDLGPDHTGLKNPNSVMSNYDASLFLIGSLNSYGARKILLLKEDGHIYYPIHKRDYSSEFVYLKSMTLSPINKKMMFIVNGNQLWQTDLTRTLPLPINIPHMTSYNIAPNWVDDNSFSSFETNIGSGVFDPIMEVSFSEFSENRGPYNYLGSPTATAGSLYNDGQTGGDQNIDNTFTNTKVWEYMNNTPMLPETLSVRMHLWTEDIITSYDLYPFYIVEEGLTSIDETLKSDFDLKLSLKSKMLEYTFTNTKYQNFQWKLFSLNGQLLKSSIPFKLKNQEVFSDNINVNRLDSGMYFFVLNFDGLFITEKIIIH